MAEYNIIRIKLAIGYDATYTANRIVYSKWDDSSSRIRVYLYESDDDTLVGEQTTGPEFWATEEEVLDYGYKFCNSTTLNYFEQSINAFPYVTRLEQENSIQCVPFVCDLKINPDVNITFATNATTADGSITVTATSTAPFIHFRITPTGNFRNSSGVFENLLPGNYTIRARDSYGCYDELTVTVGSLDTYGVKYRAEYDSSTKGRDHTSRIDILELDYSGSITEICAGDNPISIQWGGSTRDKFEPILPSSAVIQLASESNYQFIEFASANERQYKVNFYKDTGSGFELKWTGYVIPEIYEEPIVAAPYIVTITCTDGLADLDNRDFGQQKGELPVIKIISQCLQKSNLTIDINSAVDIFEASFNTASSDDPLAQTYFETYWLKDFKCAEVIRYMLEPFGARIYQSNGVWWITRIEPSADTFPYRTFNYKGTYQSNSTYDPVKYIDNPTEVNRFAWKDSSGKLRLLPTYGNIYIEHTANLINNLFYTGRFELDDITGGFFTGWTINIGNGVSYGAERIARGEDGSMALFVDFNNAEVSSSATLLSEAIDFEYSPVDYINISFEYLIYSILQLPYLRFKWQLKTSTHYMKADGTWTSTETWINEYATTLNSFKKVEVRSKLALGVTLSTLQLKIQMLGNHPYDASSLTNFKAIATDGELLTGERRIALDTIGGVNVLRYYRLEEGDDTESSPTILRPDDYAGGGGGNQRVWKQTEVLAWDGLLVNQAKSYLIDNIKVEFFINNEDPPDEIGYWTSIDQKNKLDLEKEIQIGDLPDIANAVRLYKHFFVKSNGIATATWARDNYDEALPLLTILSKDYSVQLKKGVRNIYGTLVGDQDLQMVDTLVDTFGNDENYCLTELTWNDKEGFFDVNAHQIVTDGDNGFTTGFSLGFRA